ncbi:helix-turn-helix domain-containing protein [Klebsiella variicola]|uniref:helix-turn-helix domain-containing protein n=1 Tax=Klebsiella variicola TaxID=244366 RepID=UPI001D1842D7|nr:LysR family transcriptional regulator [Klebsiella variicola]MCZ3531024.1 LysR family transcriptional regulator [Klebsiella variicola]UNA35866.1 LysR family transcriptional regulator [Klebsiella variicola subsp. variicola]
MFDDFDELMAFVCVAEAGSFIGASLRLERDASVISRRVSHLEKNWVSGCWCVPPVA